MCQPDRGMSQSASVMGRGLCQSEVCCLSVKGVILCLCQRYVSVRVREINVLVTGMCLC